MNIVLGYQENLGRRFLIDSYIGLGIRFRYINTVNKEFNPARDSLIMPTDLNINAAMIETEAKAGFSTAPNLSIGLRICYRL